MWHIHLPNPRNQRYAPRQPVGRPCPEQPLDPGGLILFVDDGQLSALEYWWVTEEMPDVFPPMSAVGKPIVTVK